MRMKDDGHFLLPPSEVRKFDECVANKDYDGAISIEAYTSDREFFMGLDEEDENADYTTEVKIYDLLSFISRVTDAEAGIDINYDKKFYLNRAMARSILAIDEEKFDHERAQRTGQHSSSEVQLSPGKITENLISGVRYCFICSHDFDNYCHLYHRSGVIFSVELDDKKCYDKLCKVFPVFRDFRNSATPKISEWEWAYIGGSCVLLVHEEVLKAYRMRTGYTDYLDWNPDDACMTIWDLLKEEENMVFEPTQIDNNVLSNMSDYQYDREGIPDQLILKESMLHDNSVKSIRVKEGFLSDGRSYVSEYWAWNGITNVTYYFAANGVEESETALEEYFVSVGKLTAGEEHPMGIMTLDVEGEKVYSVTVTVGHEDTLYGEARM